MSREAMKLALEALEKVSTRTVIMGSTGDYREGQLDALSAVSNDVATAIFAIKEALAEQPAQQEPQKSGISGSPSDPEICNERSAQACGPVYCGDSGGYCNNCPKHKTVQAVKSCNGMNCGCTDMRSHSLECQAELAAAIAGGMFVSSVQPAQQQEPVAWRNAALRVGEDLCSVGPFGYYDMTAEQWLDWALSVVTVHAPPRTQPPAQQDLPDLIAGALGVSRGTAYDLMREALVDQRKQVGDSRFESWYSEDFDPKGKGTKQQMGEAYEAGMNDPSPPAQQEPVALGPLAKRRVFDYIRGAYDLGYNDARNEKAIPGDSAPGYKGRDVEADHGSALFHALEAINALREAPAERPSKPDYVWPTVADYERDVGFQTNEAFRMAWDMARTTNTILGIKENT